MDLGPIWSIKWSITIDLHWWCWRWRLTLGVVIPLVFQILAFSLIQMNLLFSETPRHTPLFPYFWDTIFIPSYVNSVNTHTNAHLSIISCASCSTLPLIRICSDGPIINVEGLLSKVSYGQYICQGHGVVAMLGLPDLPTRNRPNFSSSAVLRIVYLEMIKRH